MVKKIIGMVLAFLAVTVLGVGVFAYTIYQQGTQTLSKTYKKIGEETNVIETTEPLTILLMGVDTGNVERTDPWEGNSDSMILLTVNPHTKKTTMMSLERDILTKIQHKDGGIRSEAKRCLCWWWSRTCYFNYSTDDEYPYRSLYYGQYARIATISRCSGWNYR